MAPWRLCFPPKLPECKMWKWNPFHVSRLARALWYTYILTRADVAVHPETLLHRRWCIWCRLESRVFCSGLLEALYFWSLHQSHHDDSDKLSIIDIYTTPTLGRSRKTTHFSCECCWVQRIILYALRAIKMNKVNNHVSAIKHTDVPMHVYVRGGLFKLDGGTKGQRKDLCLSHSVFCPSCFIPHNSLVIPHSTSAFSSIICQLSSFSSSTPCNLFLSPPPSLVFHLWHDCPSLLWLS